MDKKKQQQKKQNKKTNKNKPINVKTQSNSNNSVFEVRNAIVLVLF